MSVSKLVKSGGWENTRDFRRTDATSRSFNSVQQDHETLFFENESDNAVTGNGERYKNILHEFFW